MKRERLTEILQIYYIFNPYLIHKNAWNKIYHNEKIGRYDFVEGKSNYGGQYFEPFPVVEGYSFPFSYSRFFTEAFRGKKIDLKGKESDTAYFEVQISEKGKALVLEVAKEKTPRPKTYYDIAPVAEKFVCNDPFHYECIESLLSIKQWFPGFYEYARQGRLKGQLVMKPNKVDVASTGIVRVIFTTVPFDWGVWVV